MKQHVGKKRRKEIRESIEMSAEMRSYTKKCILLVALLVVNYCSYFLVTGLTEYGSQNPMTILIIWCIIVVILVSLLYKQYTNRKAIRNKLNEHNMKFNITMEEIAQYKDSKDE